MDDLVYIEVLKKNAYDTIRLYIMDQKGRVHKIIDDPTADLNRSVFTYNGMNSWNKRSGRGLYYIVPEVNGTKDKNLFRKLLIEYNK